VPTLHERGGAAVARLARLWNVVLAANVIGTLAFAAAVAHSDLFASEVRDAFTTIGLRAAEPGFATTFVRAIAAGWMIALMVWLQPAAGSADVALVATTGAIDWTTYRGGFLVPALLGNTIGGAILVAALNHAQISSAEVP
jgi:formate/nitrite transporter FocA (FNT family)